MTPRPTDRDGIRAAGSAARPKPTKGKDDGRGDWRSDKRELRRQVCARHGVTSGRQWVRLRKALARHQRRAPSRAATSSAGV